MQKTDKKWGGAEGGVGWGNLIHIGEENHKDCPCYDCVSLLMWVYLGIYNIDYTENIGTILERNMNQTPNTVPAAPGINTRTGFTGYWTQHSLGWRIWTVWLYKVLNIGFTFNQYYLHCFYGSLVLLLNYRLYYFPVNH